MSFLLEKSTFEITDRDRSTGIYHTKFSGPQSDENGWFDWLLGGDEDPLIGRDFIVTMTSQDENQVTIRLQALEGTTPLKKREEQGLLSLIKGSIN